MIQYGAQPVVVMNPGITVLTESPMHTVAAASDNELREDGTYILREDGFKIVRE